mmetsp:Transcript_24488/g.53257  ORF Transcript_24488/g.53257 Transcript_24488/m.53257 type:complete len:117 (+) Transcript_24488:1492-1842(+)
MNRHSDASAPDDHRLGGVHTSELVAFNEFGFTNWGFILREIAVSRTVRQILLCSYHSRTALARCLSLAQGRCRRLVEEQCPARPLPGAAPSADGYAKDPPAEFTQAVERGRTASAG